MLLSLDVFKEYFEGDETKLPITIAYGYTCDRETIYIQLFDDMVSRILTDSHGEIIERKDYTSSKSIDISELLFNHKRFYSNTIDSRFIKLCDDFNADIAITNSLAKNTDFPIFYPEKFVKKDNYYIPEKCAGCYSVKIYSRGCFCGEICEYFNDDSMIKYVEKCEKYKTLEEVTLERLLKENEEYSNKINENNKRIEEIKNKLKK